MNSSSSKAIALLATALLAQKATSQSSSSIRLHLNHDSQHRLETVEVFSAIGKFDVNEADRDRRTLVSGRCWHVLELVFLVRTKLVVVLVVLVVIIFAIFPPRLPCPLRSLLCLQLLKDAINLCASVAIQ
jgi:hypothetical protein